MNYSRIQFLKPWAKAEPGWEAPFAVLAYSVRPWITRREYVDGHRKDIVESYAIVFRLNLGFMLWDGDFEWKGFKNLLK